jgi:hypothetical protein
MKNKKTNTTITPEEKYNPLEQAYLEEKIAFTINEQKTIVQSVLSQLDDVKSSQEETEERYIKLRNSTTFQNVLLLLIVIILILFLYQLI